MEGKFDRVVRSLLIAGLLLLGVFWGISKYGEKVFWYAILALGLAPLAAFACTKNSLSPIAKRAIMLVSVIAALPAYILLLFGFFITAPRTETILVALAVGVTALLVSLKTSVRTQKVTLWFISAEAFIMGVTDSLIYYSQESDISSGLWKFFFSIPAMIIVAIVYIISYIALRTQADNGSGNNTTTNPN